VSASYPLYVRTGTNQRARFVDNGGLFQMAVLNDAETAYSDMSLGNSAVVIKSGGNVGIGTLSPSFKFESLASSATMASFGTSSASGGYVQIKYNTSSINGYLGAGNQLVSGGAVADMALTSDSGSILVATSSGAERMRITSGGNVLIGKTTTNIDAADGVRFDENGSIFASIVTGEATYYVRDITNSVYRFFVNAAGTINATNTTISAISDVRLKENITDLEIGLDAIMALRPRKSICRCLTN